MYSAVGLIIPSSIYFFFALNIYLSKYPILLKNIALSFTILWVSANVITKRPEKDIGFQKMMRVVDFMKNKSGNIAMGDAAGLPGYLLSNPIIQLEGLVMDFDYLEMLKMRNLDKIFKKYNIDYYISITAKQSEDGIWTFTEPWEHHPFIINCTKKTEKQPIFQTGDSWPELRIWKVKD